MIFELMGFSQIIASRFRVVVQLQYLISTWLQPGERELDGSSIIPYHHTSLKRGANEMNPSLKLNQQPFSRRSQD
jgi:hypothetical protein